MLQDLTVKAFAEELASNSPAPGGGSAAALAAALGSSLGSMVFNLTVGKKAYNDYDEQVKVSILQALNNTNEEKTNFLNLMEKDAEEFLELMAAFKLPKNTEEEISVRANRIEQGYIKALQVPLNVAVKAFEMYKHIELAANYGNKNAVSDAGVAALLLQTAIESAVLNVKINLSGIKDETYKCQVQDRCNKLIEAGLEKRNFIMDIVNSKL
ncbi:cyclodeaminase/cyclohydrolase family protein [Clostridium swellfunianum]|uniref:cyclodeaminase/cyclohydrolase family protein n=1 Tax=Clostridium swellfunianum TaxID=1367462 RepID=UPI00202FE4A3|nr:cyclodeaminase/cyclohydrolase family protein [Clostridium swellfunianum]MCM0650571.1 cyclodeaminase/cyclohydrolase family protein [Clostridium swellfunianum]